MKDKLIQLEYLLQILYDAYHFFPREFGSKHDNYFTYKRQIFEHELRGRVFIEKLTEVDFNSTISDNRKKEEYYNEDFAQGKCAMIDENLISFHYALSETLFCYAAYILKDDLEMLLEYLKSEQIKQQFPGARIDDHGCFVYPYMIHNNLWEVLKQKLEFPELIFNFLYKIGKYAGAKTTNSMEFQVNKIDELLGKHINGYDFITLDNIVIP